MGKKGRPKKRAGRADRHATRRQPVWLDPVWHELLKRIAEDQGRDMTEVVRRLLALEARRRGIDHPPIGLGD